jgi:hypothetical protein
MKPFNAVPPARSAQVIARDGCESTSVLMFWFPCSQVAVVLNGNLVMYGGGGELNASSESGYEGCSASLPLLCLPISDHSLLFFSQCHLLFFIF